MTSTVLNIFSLKVCLKKNENENYIYVKENEILGIFIFKFFKIGTKFSGELNNK